MLGFDSSFWGFATPSGKVDKPCPGLRQATFKCSGGQTVKRGQGFSNTRQGLPTTWEGLPKVCR
eukprot:15462395-Alexandrium_andersonii.AAC.1